MQWAVLCSVQWAVLCSVLCSVQWAVLCSVLCSVQWAVLCSVQWAVLCSVLCSYAVLSVHVLCSPDAVCAPQVSLRADLSGPRRAQLPGVVRGGARSLPRQCGRLGGQRSPPSFGLGLGRSGGGRERYCTLGSGVRGGALTEVDAALSSDADSETADGDSDGDDARGGGEERTETAAEAEYDLAALSDPAFLDTVLKRSNGRVPIVDVQSRVTQVRCLLCTRAVSVVFIWSD